MKSITVRATILAFASVAAIQAQASDSKQLSTEQLRALGFQNQAQAEQALSITSASLDEMPDSPTSAYTDMVFPPVALPTTTPIPQAPSGAGAGGTWNPNPGGGTPAQQSPTVPANSSVPAPIPGTPSWNAAIQSITGLDIQGWIAIGTTFSQIVIANQPVVNVATPSLSILPQSQPNWTMMSGWGIPIVKHFQLKFYNGLGITVVSIPYTITYNAGGSLNGAGRYIANLRLLVSDLNVAWGFNVDMSTQARDALNMGSVGNPIPGISLDVKLKIHTYLKEKQITTQFFVTGNGRLLNCSANQCSN